MKSMQILFIAMIPTFVLADDLYTNDIIGGCGDAYYFNAEFEPINYTCNSGQFLPAGATSCQTCPNTHTCNGGTFSFDANHTQGLSDGDILVTNAIGSCSPQFNQSFTAIFEIITYTCLPGYYLPADTESCVICPENSYCVGGTYSFNETTNQGIESCNNSFAPIGSTKCYEHILHVGNEVLYLSSTKTTTPSLNVAYGDNVYYANATITPTTMTAGSEQYLKTIYNNIVYYICDDTICPQ